MLTEYYFGQVDGSLEDLGSKLNQTKLLLKLMLSSEIIQSDMIFCFIYIYNFTFSMTKVLHNLLTTKKMSF